MEVSDELHALAVLPPGEKHLYPLTRKQGGRQSRSGRFGEEKSLAYSDYIMQQNLCIITMEISVGLDWRRRHHSSICLCLTSEAQRNHFLVKPETWNNKHAPRFFCLLDRAFSIMKTKINQQNAQINSGLICYWSITLTCFGPSIEAIIREFEILESYKAIVLIC